MRYHFFLTYGWFFQNLGKEAVRTFMHTTVGTSKLTFLFLILISFFKVITYLPERKIFPDWQMRNPCLILGLLCNSWKSQTPLICVWKSSTAAELNWIISKNSRSPPTETRTEKYNQHSYSKYNNTQCTVGTFSK